MKIAKSVFIGCWMVMVGFSSQAASPHPTSVDGTIIHRGDKDYRIVSLPELHQIRVYVSGSKESLPSVLVLDVKRRNKLLEKLHLTLDVKDPERAHYSGIVPASVFVSGGITFDIDFK